MIIDYKQIDFANKVVFETALADAPHNFSYPFSDEACFIHVKQGSNTTLSSKEKVNVPQGHYVLANCGNFIFKTVPDKSTGLYQATVIHFHKDFVLNAFSNGLPGFLMTRKSDKWSDLATSKSSILVDKYVDDILFYLENPQLINEEIMNLKIKEILLLLLQTNNAPQVLNLLENLFTKRSVRFKTTIEAHLYSDISLSELAHLTHMSLSTFKRKFKDIYKSTPSQYMLTKRLEKSKELLVVSELSVMEIAYDSGFKTASHFSKKFKEKFGISPSQYRLNVRDK